MLDFFAIGNHDVYEADGGEREKNEVEMQSQVLKECLKAGMNP